jgi:hypothetical protein
MNIFSKQSSVLLKKYNAIAFYGFYLMNHHLSYHNLWKKRLVVFTEENNHKSQKITFLVSCVRKEGSLNLPMKLNNEYRI